MDAKIVEQQLDALLALEDGLGAWALQFIEDMAVRRNAHADWAERLSQRQIDKLEELYERHC